MSKLSFHTTSLRKILRISWPMTISYRDLLVKTNQEDMRTIITRRRWRRLGHVLRMTAAPSQNLQCVGHRRGGEREADERQRGAELWSKSELMDMGHSWGTIGKLATDRAVWRSFVPALPARRNGQ